MSHLAGKNEDRVEETGEAEGIRSLDACELDAVAGGTEPVASERRSGYIGAGS